MPLPAAPRLVSAPLAFIRSLSGNALTAGAVMGFSLTFVGAVAAFALGYIPADRLPFAGGVDIGVVLLSVPIAALIFAVVIEAARSAFTIRFAPEPPRADNPLSAWRPGQREG